MDTDTLQSFCAHSLDTMRPRLHTPWRYLGHIYASNGHIAVRIADDGRDGVQDGDTLPFAPRAVALIEAAIKANCPPASFAAPPRVDCEHCNGTGTVPAKTNVDCPTCLGFGHVGADSVTCPTCDGHCTVAGPPSPTETESCYHCDGSGESMVYVPVGDSGYQARYLRMIAALPGVELFPNGPDAPALFVWAGGLGILMPMTAPRKGRP